MRHFIVIGNPINHSKSPLLHQEFARQTGLTIAYNRQFCPADKDSFRAVVDAFFNGGGIGANVTLPFKEWAFELCQTKGALSDFAQTAGAVNTLFIKNNSLYGDNTDGRGLVADLLSKNISLQGATIAILGAGGATRGAILPLLNAGAAVRIFNRTTEKAQNLVHQFNAFNANQKLTAHALDELAGKFDVIINATSAGTNNQSLNLSRYPISATYAYDMAYGKQTEFLSHFANKEATCYDGIGMLIHQGLIAFGQWNDVDIANIDLNTIERLLTN